MVAHKIGSYGFQIDVTEPEEGVITVNVGYGGHPESCRRFSETLVRHVREGFVVGDVDIDSPPSDGHAVITILAPKTTKNGKPPVGFEGVEQLLAGLESTNFALPPESVLKEYERAHPVAHTNGSTNGDHPEPAAYPSAACAHRLIPQVRVLGDALEKEKARLGINDAQVGLLKVMARTALIEGDSKSHGRG